MNSHSDKRRTIFDSTKFLGAIKPSIIFNTSSDLAGGIGRAIKNRSQFLTASLTILAILFIQGCSSLGDNPDAHLVDEVSQDNSEKVEYFVPSTTDLDENTPKEGPIDLDQKPELKDLKKTTERAEVQATMVYPQPGQVLGYGGHYMFKARGASGSSRTAMLIRQGSTWVWNDYWGNDGRNRVLNIWQGTSAHSRIQPGQICITLWDWMGTYWWQNGAYCFTINGGNQEWANPAPASDLITSDFGARGSDFHSGIDFGHTQGSDRTNFTVVRAVARGVVKHIDRSWGAIIIDHGNYMTLYGHLWSQHIRPNIGDTVERDETLGALGGEGGFTPHLHFEYYQPELVDFTNLSQANRDANADSPEAQVCAASWRPPFAWTDAGVQISIADWCAAKGF